jgi:hypothetical protein
MRHAQSSPSIEAPQSRAGTHFVTWLRELGECWRGGLISNEDYRAQRTEKLDELLQPPCFMWSGPLLGGAITGAIGGATTWWFTLDWRFTALVSVLAGSWGLNSLGRIFREKFIELQLRERLETLIALLENDLITVGELAEYEDRLAKTPS